MFSVNNVVKIKKKGLITKSNKPFFKNLWKLLAQVGFQQFTP
jgi:hypothetical protein